MFKLLLTFWGFAKPPISSTDVHHSSMQNSSRNAQFSTDAVVLPNPCCTLFFFHSVNKFKINK